MSMKWGRKPSSWAAKNSYIPRKRSKTPRKTTELAKAIKDADRQVSTHVRQTRADKKGLVKCYTCTVILPIKRIHNGHYISRQYKFTRWDLDNCRPQCFACNVIKKGNSHLFRRNLVLEIGEARVLALEKRSERLFTLSPQDKSDFIKSELSKL